MRDGGGGEILGHAAYRDCRGRPSQFPQDGAETVDGRQAPAETTAYFLICEALQNTVKHARASRATVAVAREDGLVLVEVTDDGVGGADPASGSGLRGLADRVEAVGGRLSIESPAGQGTTVRAELPCG
jgi:signal transduction histidine kinase